MVMNKIEVPAAYAEDEKFCREWRKMLRGEVYDALYPPFIELLKATRVAIREYNSVRPDDTERLTEILKGLLGACGENINVVQPFYCD